MSLYLQKPQSPEKVTPGPHRYSLLCPLRHPERSEGSRAHARRPLQTTDEAEKDPGFFATAAFALNDTDGEQAGILVESQNPHLPAAAPAGLLSRKITGEVFHAAASRTSERKVVLDISRFSYHWVQGSPLPKEA
jgi:hypothetical protein